MLLTIFTKTSILDIWPGSEYVSATTNVSVGVFEGFLNC